jgi:hypothetical protein
MMGVFALALALPLTAQAAPQWCPVKPDAAALSPVKDRLAPLLDSQPHPLARIHTEGTLPHQGIWDESIAAKKDLPVMRDAAMAWRAGAGKPYLELSKRYLKAWVTIYQPSLNPIDETDFDALIDTYAIIAPKLDTDTNAAARQFLTKWAKSYIADIDAHQPGNQPPPSINWRNNWQSHRVKLVVMMAMALDDPELIAAARRIFQAHVEINIHADGEVLDFAQRDAMHYVIYDLGPLTRAALAARTHGEDWYNYQSPGGGSLAKGYAWLRPYAAGEKPHEEFKNSTVKFDAQRAAAGVAGFSGPFDTKKAGEVYWMASQFDPAYQSLAKQLQAAPPDYLALCGN